MTGNKVYHWRVLVCDEISHLCVSQCNERAGRGRDQPSQLSQIPRPHPAQRSGTAVLGKCRSVGQWACGNTTIFSYSSRKVMTACQTFWRNVYFSFLPWQPCRWGRCDDDPRDMCCVMTLGQVLCNHRNHGTPDHRKQLMAGQGG